MPIDQGSTDPTLEKRLARAAARNRLAALTPRDGAERSRLICDRILGLESAQAARTVFFFLSAGSTEPDLLPLVVTLRERFPGLVVCAPRVDWEGGTMDAVELRFGPGARPLIETRRRHIPEPLVLAGTVPVPPHRVDLVLVPGLAFDPEMGRLGRGGGFYDRWLCGPGAAPPQPGGILGKSPRIVGVCFEEQVVGRVPTQVNDVRMDAIVTDRRLLTR